MEEVEGEAAGSPPELTVAGDYTVRSKLGERAHSAVWMAERRATGETVALKHVRLSRLSQQLRSCLDWEIGFLSSVNHPNIIRLLDVFQFCDGGNLAFYIKVHGRVHEAVARRFMQQLGAGMQVLHSHFIVHRDLKPENILLSGPEEERVLKIADFGLSRTVHLGESADMVCGSPLYMAPGVLLFQRYDEKMLHGYPPYRGRTNVQLLKNIQSSASLPFSQLILRELHGDCVDMCSGLLSISPEKRISFEDWHGFLRRKRLGISFEEF